MEEFRFDALGTKWVLQSERPFSRATTEAVLRHTDAFEDRFSRFRDGSEANRFRNAKPGCYEISNAFRQMLERAERLKELTDGCYDPAVALVLEKAGYDKHYRFAPEDGTRVAIPDWHLADGQLWLSGPAGFDFGGMGKGLCIDEVAEVLRQQGHEYFLVDGGGDMYATEKASGAGFRVALEWPGRPDTAFGVVELRHQGLAASDTFRRRWADWHHIVDPVTQRPVEGVLAAYAVAPTAWDADSATAALFQLPPDGFAAAEEAFQAPYAVFLNTEEVRTSSAWPGQLFLVQP